MPDDVQLPDPPTVLLETSRRVMGEWLRRITVEACRRGGVDHRPIEAELDAMVEHASARALARMADLLVTDVDEQRTTPLTVFREAVREPTTFLRAHGASLPSASPSNAPFGEDVYRLGPATWSDIDPSLHEPGLMWGAWKAMSVLSRRRDDGMR